MKSLIAFLVLVIISGSALFYLNYKNNELKGLNEELQTHILHVEEKVKELEQGIEIMEEFQEIVEQQVEVVKEIEVRYEKEIVIQEKIIEVARESNNCIGVFIDIDELFKLD